MKCHSLRDSSERGDYLGSCLCNAASGHSDRIDEQWLPFWRRSEIVNIQIPIHHYWFPLQIRKKTKLARLWSPSHSISEVFVCLLNRKQKSILSLPFLQHSALFQRPCWLFVMLSAWICCKRWWARSWLEESFYHFLWTSLVDVWTCSRRFSIPDEASCLLRLFVRLFMRSD